MVLIKEMLFAGGCFVLKVCRRRFPDTLKLAFGCWPLAIGEQPLLESDCSFFLIHSILSINSWLLNLAVSFVNWRILNYSYQSSQTPTNNSHSPPQSSQSSQTPTNNSHSKPQSSQSSQSSHTPTKHPNSHPQS